MAAVTINFTLTDAKGKSRMTKVRVPTGFHPSAYGEFALAMGQIIANLSDGAITEISIGIPLDISTASIKLIAETFADAAKKVFFGALSTVSGLFAKFIIPTYDETFTVSGSDDVDVAAPEVAALIALIESGTTIGGTPIAPVDKYDNSLDDVNIAREQFRRFN
jgi:hypothetical protein